MPNNDEKKYLDWEGLQYYHESLRDSISEEIDDAVATAVPKSVVTTAGDLIVGNGNASVTRLAKGTAGQALVSTASGLEWQTIEATDTTYTFTEGTTNGAFSVTPSTPGATTQSVPIHGLMGAAYKGVSTSIGSAATDATVPTAKAVYDAIANLPEPMVFKGTLGTGGTITDLPTASASNEGYTYKVITAGTYASQAAKVGDVFVCAKLTSSTYGWVLIPAGDTDTDTVRQIKVNGNDFLGTGISTGYLNLVAGTNVSLSTANSHDVTITATDTNYYATSDFSSITAANKLKIATGYSSGTASSTYDLYVPNADATHSGVITTSAQTFSGEKTFTFAPIVTGTAEMGSTSKIQIFGDGLRGFVGNTPYDYVFPVKSGTFAMTNDITVAGVTDGMFDLSVSSKNISVAPYSAEVATSDWLANPANGGKFYLGDEIPQNGQDKLSFNGSFVANDLIAHYVSVYDTEDPTNNIELAADQGQLYITDGDTEISYRIANIIRNSPRTEYTYTFPNKNGTFAMTSDVPTYEDIESAFVTLDTDQTISGVKEYTSKPVFTSGIRFSSTAGSGRYIDVVGSPFDDAYTLTLPNKTGTIATLSDIPSFADTNQKVKVGNTTFGDNAEINFVAGSNVSITGTATGTGAPMITFNATDTNYYAKTVATTGLKIGTGYSGSTVNTEYDLYVPDADITHSGVVTIGSQEFMGVKEFLSRPVFSGGIRFASGKGSSYYVDIVGPSYDLNHYTLTLPLKSGTIATLEDIPTMTAITNNEIDTLFGNA